MSSTKPINVFYLIISLLISILLIIFAFQNKGQLDVNFFGAVVNVPKPLGLLLISIFGFLIGMLVTLKYLWNSNQKLKATEKLNRELAIEIALLHKKIAERY